MPKTQGSQQVFVVAPDAQQLAAVSRTDFRAIGFKERRDLQRFIAQHPGMLQEELLVLCEEFDRFQNSSRRLDLLCLDKDGRLVIVELKLDATSGTADLQALRYAAFCAGMTREQVVDAHRRYHDCGEEQAVARIAEFLPTGQSYPVIQPRIIVAAGAFDDQELTATVLWLREFNVDISVIELAPYRLDDGKVLVAPRRLIPLREAQEYQVRVEQRTAESNAAAGKAATRRNQILDEMARLFNASDARVPFNEGVRAHYRQGRSPIPRIHYEFLWRAREGCVAVGIHFESKHLDLNVRRLDAVTHDIPAGRRRVLQGRWGDNEVWTRYERLIPFEEPDLGAVCVQEMRSLVEETWDRVRALTDRS